MKKELPKTVLLHKNPESLAQNIKAHFPNLPLILIDNYSDVPQSLRKEKPEVFFAFKTGEEDQFPRSAVLNCESIKWIQASGAGVDHWTPWDPTIVTVTNASGIHAEIMAQYTTWAILNQKLGFPRMAERQSQKKWDKKLLESVVGQTLVIVGYGRIGKEVGRLAKTIGLKVIGVRKRPSPCPYADEVVSNCDLRNALGKADFILNVLPLTEETRGFFNTDIFYSIKKGAYLINTGRGHVIDECALVEALRSGQLSGATLDVFADEPLPSNNPLWTTNNVIITPHTAGDAVDWEDAITDLFCDNLRRWKNNEKLENIVDPSRGY